MLANVKFGTTATKMVNTSKPSMMCVMPLIGATESQISNHCPPVRSRTGVFVSAEAHEKDKTIGINMTPETNKERLINKMASESWFAEDIIIALQVAFPRDSQLLEDVCNHPSLLRDADNYLAALLKFVYSDEQIGDFLNHPPGKYNGWLKEDFFSPQTEVLANYDREGRAV